MDKKEIIILRSECLYADQIDHLIFLNIWPPSLDISVESDQLASSGSGIFSILGRGSRAF